MAASGERDKGKSKPIANLVRETPRYTGGSNPSARLCTDNAKRHGWDQTQSRFTLQRTESRVRTNPTESAEETQRDAGGSKPDRMCRENAKRRGWEQTQSRKTQNAKKHKMGGNPTDIELKTLNETGGSKPNAPRCANLATCILHCFQTRTDLVTARPVHETTCKRFRGYL